MVGHRFVEAAVEHGARPARRRRRGAAPGLRPGAPVGRVRRHDGRRADARRARPVRHAGRRARARRPRRRPRHRGRHGDDGDAGGRSPTGPASSPPGRSRSCRRSPASTPPARSSTARSTTSTRSGPGRSGATTGVVVGGGLLGLEAANALRLLGIDTTVVEFAPRLMAVQLDDGGGRALRRHVEALGLDVRTGAAAAAVRTTEDGRVAGLSFAEGAGARRRHGRVRRRHPAPRPARPRRRPGDRRARRHRRRRPLRHVRARRLRHRRGRLPRRPRLRARRARLPRWPRSSPTASPAATPRSPAPTCRRR